MQTKYIKEIGIIISYLILFMGTIFFDIDPITIFVSFLVEFFILILVFCVVNFFSTRWNKPSGNIFLAGLILIAMQLLTIAFLNYFMNGEGANNDFENWFNFNTILTAFVILFLYALRLFKIPTKEERELYAQDNLILQALVLIGLNLIGFFVAWIFSPTSLTAVMLIVVASRIILELYINKTIKKES